MSKLSQLLRDLGKDSDLHDAYVDNPKDVMSRYQLTDEETQAMLDKDVEKLKKLSGIEKLKSNSIVDAYD